MRDTVNHCNEHVRLSEWRSNVCSAITKQTAKSTYGLIGFFNDLGRSLRESKWAKRQQRLWTIPSWRFAAFAASHVTAGGGGGVGEKKSPGNGGCWGEERWAWGHPHKKTSRSRAG